MQIDDKFTEKTVQDSFYRARLLSAWDAEYKTIRHNILKFKKERIYALADLIDFVERLDHCMRHVHFTDENCAVLLQRSGDIIDAVAPHCMVSTYDVVLNAINKLLSIEMER